MAPEVLHADGTRSVTCPVCGVLIIIGVDVYGERAPDRVLALGLVERAKQHVCSN